MLILGSSKALSCLVYALRPLSVDELCEAIAISDHEVGENLDANCQVFKSRLRDLCAPLVTYDEVFSRSGHKYIVTLAHSSIKTFLIRKQDVLSAGGDAQISPTRLAWATINYLRQPRYSKPLKKVKGTFETAHKENIIDHHLLNYCAKYWYRQMDNLTYSIEVCQEVESFVRSENFFTCLQVQSILVGGESSRHANNLVGLLIWTIQVSSRLIIESGRYTKACKPCACFQLGSSSDTTAARTFNASIRRQFANGGTIWIVSPPPVASSQGR
jgi:hypothetical protein